MASKKIQRKKPRKKTNRTKAHTKRNSKKKIKRKTQHDDLESLLFELKLMISNPEYFYIALQSIALIAVLFFLFFNAPRVAFERKTLIFDGFIYENNSVYANLIIRPLSLPAYCNLSATYLNKTYIERLVINQSPLVHKMLLKNLPRGNTKIYFLINCSYPQIRK